MLTLAAIGGFFIPIIFGHLVPHTSFTAGWIFLTIVSLVFAALGLAGRNPSTRSSSRTTPRYYTAVRPSRPIMPTGSPIP